MRTSVLAMLFVFLSFPSQAFAQTDREIPVEIERLSDRVAVFRIGAAQETNITALKSSRGIVVVDAEMSPTFAAAIRSAIEREFGTEIAYLINTHGHGDHTYGNQVFADVPVIGHTETSAEISMAGARRENTVTQLSRGVSALQARMEGVEEGSEAAKSIANQIFYYQTALEGLATGFVLTLPTITFSDRLTLALGDLTIELSWFGLQHSISDIMIWCPEESILLTGDVFPPGSIEPYIDTERLAYLPRWIEVLSGILESAPEDTRVIPGHGELIPVTGLREWLAAAEAVAPKYAGKTSALTRMKEAYEQQGAEAAVAALKDIHIAPDRYFMLHPELDTYAYRLMLDDDLDDALKIFLTLAELFPEADVAFDSLGEVYVRLEKKDEAIKSFEAALRLNPDNQNSARRLQELKKPPPQTWRMYP